MGSAKRGGRPSFEGHRRRTLDSRNLKGKPRESHLGQTSGKSGDSKPRDSGIWGVQEINGKIDPAEKGRTPLTKTTAYEL